MILNTLSKHLSLKLREYNRFSFFSISLKNLVNFSTIQNPLTVTAGVLIIGDEILNGQAEDTNTSFLIKNLNLSGIKVKKVSIVPDDTTMIAQEVSSLSKSCTVVLTSGGIGPTHDDVTYEAVAKALGEELVINDELCKLFTDYFGSQASQNSAFRKFLCIPKSAVLNYKTDSSNQKSGFPLVSAKNIFMFPGVPIILRRSYDVFKSKFQLFNEPVMSEAIYLTSDEFMITPLLNDAVKKFEDHVKFGSYPSFTHNYYRVKITMESADKGKIKEAKAFFMKQIPKEKFFEFKNQKIETSINDVTTLCLENPTFTLAANVIQQALKTYDMSEMCICFNGGKDCTALLHLLYTYMIKEKLTDSNKINALYVRNGETFNEIEDFIQNSVSAYNMTLTVIEGDLKTALSQFLHSRPEIRAVIMGTRRCDPGSDSLRYFNPTDKDWPPLMRILPILDWSYSDVWNFIRQLQLPYCVLYDRGYTSIGLKSQTVKNSALLLKSSKSLSYKPAYMLNNENEERNGRL